MRLILSLQETFIAIVSDLLLNGAETLGVDDTARLRAVIRDHRVGMIKQRAVMGALEIDV